MQRATPRRAGGARIKGKKPKPAPKSFPTPDFTKVLTADEAREEYEKRKDDAKKELVGKSGREQSGATRVERLTKKKMQDAADSGHSVYEIQDPGIKHGYSTEQVVAMFRMVRASFKRFRGANPTLHQDALRKKMMQMDNSAGHAIRVFAHYMPTGFQMATEQSMMTKDWEEFIEFQLVSMIEAANGLRNMAATKREINRRYKALTTRRMTKDDERKAVTITSAEDHKKENPDSRKERRTMSKHGIE